MEGTPKSERLGRLIAAAPEMYELLKFFVRTDKRTAEYSNVLEEKEKCQKARELLARIG